VINMNVLVLSPHTDDAELGAGATISKLVAEGHVINYVVFSVCSDSLPSNLPKDTLKKEFLRVLNDFGISDYIILDYQVRHFFEHRQEILEKLVEIKKEFLPDLVLLPSTYDNHQDHQVVVQEGIRAFKNSSSIIGYELPTNYLSFDFSLLWQISLNNLNQKLKVLRNYDSQILLNRPYFNNDFIIGLAKVRGVMAGVEYAEAFQVIRWIQK